MLTPTVHPTPHPSPQRPARAPATRADKPTGQGAKTAGRGGAGAARCYWCNRKLKGQHAVTCSHSCRSSLSRFKKRACANTLVAALGMPKPVAERLISAVGLPEVERRLNALGWYWHAPDRAWERENAQPYREVA